MIPRPTLSAAEPSEVAFLIPSAFIQALLHHQGIC